jgi:hypothetical protein
MNNGINTIFSEFLSTFVTGAGSMPLVQRLIIYLKEPEGVECLQQIIGSNG